MSSMKFFYQYILEYKTVGAILPSSKKLAKRMICNVDFNNCDTIVEYGPGTGVFTDEIIRNRRNVKTKILLIEYNNDFYNELRKKYRSVKNIYIINDSAENIEIYLRLYNIKKVDYVISGLPFASLDNNISEKILYNTNRILGKNGKFITFQYTLLKKHMINKYFGHINVDKEFINIPPAYVLNCNNKNII